MVITDMVNVHHFSSEERGQFELRMPQSKPKEPETYLCTTIRLDENNTYFVTGFDPKASNEKRLT